MADVSVGDGVLVVPASDSNIGDAGRDYLAKEICTVTWVGEGLVWGNYVRVRIPSLDMNDVLLRKSEVFNVPRTGRTDHTQ